MFANEGLFRLFSIGLLSILFVSATAMANKQKKEQPESFFAVTEHIEEAEKINNGELHVLNLTSIGERTEVVKPSQKKK